MASEIPNATGGDSGELEHVLAVTVRCASKVGVTTDVTPAVRAACDGVGRCILDLNEAGLGVDPYVGCAKRLTVELACVDEQGQIMAGLGQTREAVSLPADSPRTRPTQLRMVCHGPKFATLPPALWDSWGG